MESTTDTVILKGTGVFYYGMIAKEITKESLEELGWKQTNYSTEIFLKNGFMLNLFYHKRGNHSWDGNRIEISRVFYTIKEGLRFPNKLVRFDGNIFNTTELLMLEKMIGVGELNKNSVPYE